MSRETFVDAFYCLLILIIFRHFYDYVPKRVQQLALLVFLCVRENAAEFNKLLRVHQLLRLLDFVNESRFLHIDVED